MLDMFSKRRDLKIRAAILRGVYEDNLRIMGKHSASLSRGKTLFLKKSFLFLSVFIFTFWGHDNYLDTSSIYEREVKINIVVQNPSAGSDQKPINPSEYKAFINIPDVQLSRMFGLKVKTIMIDPGHGGTDPGAIGKMGTKEKDITLDIAKRLKERLEKYGNLNVLMTRYDDSTLSLNRRVEIAKSARADIFISIHLNYLPKRPINIIETYYFGPPTDDTALKLAEKENAGSQYGLSDFKEMIEKLGEALKLQESQVLATSIQKNLFINSKKHNRNIYNYGVKRAPFVVLLGIDVPAVLVEVSCLSNKLEEMKLNTETHRENIARYLEAGVLDYLNNKGEVIYEAKR